MPVTHVAENVARNELAFILAGRTGDDVINLARQIAVSYHYSVVSDGWQIYASWGDRCVTLTASENDMRLPIDAFAEKFLVPIAEAMAPTDPDLGLWAQFMARAA